jgi:uncharacterized protein YfaP (DUF2135 family)
LDLHVIEPSGEETDWTHMQSASGGTLDLDSYPACEFANDRGRGNENVYWPVEGAPSGEYLVQVHMWSDCDTFLDGLTTNYRVTLVVDHGDGPQYEVHEGAFAPGDPELVDVTRFTY